MGEYEDAADTGDSGDAETTEPAETSEPTETTETPGAAEARDRAGWDDAGLADLVAGSGAGGDSSEWTGGSRISNRPGPLPAFSDADAASPPVVGASDAEIGTALADGAVVAVPGVGGYCLAVRVGTPGGEARLEALAADPDGPHYAVGHVDDVRGLTSGWSDEVEGLLHRCWPGPVDVFLPRAVAGGVNAAGDEGGEPSAADGETAEAAGSNGDAPAPALADEGELYESLEGDRGGWAVTVGMPDGRAMRRLCKEHGPWRTVPLTFNEATEVAHAFDAADVALVVDGGRRDGQLPTLVDATVTPVRVLREGALPANFIDATMAMRARKRWFGRSRPKS
jgi:tRNA A37 threonylcarbamoyladenosine synthetase subunit TsaC/SUA5/YrdC